MLIKILSILFSFLATLTEILDSMDERISKKLTKTRGASKKMIPQATHHCPFKFIFSKPSPEAEAETKLCRDQSCLKSDFIITSV